MNIFTITYYDLGGGPHRLATAINENTEHCAIAARWDEERWTTGGLYAPNEAKIRELYEWADVIQIQNTIICHIPPDLLCTKPTIFYYRGSDFRDHYPEMRERAKSMGALESVNFLDLAGICGVERWLPTVVWDLSHFRAPQDGFKVAQCPSARARFRDKNTQQVVQVMSNVPDVQFELITDLGWVQGLQRKGRCDAIIGQFVWGYGNSGVEAMSMGIPVLSDAIPSIIEQMEHHIGYIPFIRCPINELPNECTRLKDDLAYRREWGERGRQYWVDFHSPPAVARRAIEMFQETIDLWEGAK